MTDQVVQLGVAGLTLGILFFVVKYFTKTIERKDMQMTKLVGDFNLTVRNHMKHETIALRELTKAIQELSNRGKSRVKERKK